MISLSISSKIFIKNSDERRIISRLTDWDVRQLCRDPYWSILNVLPGKFWRDRARKNYVNSESEILLAQNFEIFGFYDYVNFILTGKRLFIPTVTSFLQTSSFIWIYLKNISDKFCGFPRKFVIEIYLKKNK